MTDMLVKLYSERKADKRQQLGQQGLAFKRALALDKNNIVNFITASFGDDCAGWADECLVSLYRQPSSCFLALHNKSVVGFACYDATAKAMVGPIGVHRSHRNKGIASVLLNLCFDAMKMDGYAYAIIGWVSSTEFYRNNCNAIEIPDSFPGIYSRLSSQD